MNEVDAAKVKIGQKASLTFDAIDSLEISGKVADVDTLGTVTQGVVTYSVKISMDTPDDRVKPGMSVNASIITDVKQDVIAVPNSAIKNQNGSSYVEMLNAKVPTDQESLGITSTTQPKQQPVITGVSDDTNTEITSGLNVGDQVVTKTTTGITKTTAATTTAPSLFGSGGGGLGGGLGGGAARALGR